MAIDSPQGEFTSKSSFLAILHKEVCDFVLKHLID